MAAPTPRRVRLARNASAPMTPSPPEPASPGDTAGVGARRVENRAATARARRITLLFVVVLAALYLAFALLSRSSAAGGSPGAATDLALFGVVALAVALAGALLTLLSAPAAVEITPTATVVQSVFRARYAFPHGPGYSVRIVRRFPAGPMSPEPIEVVEIGAGPVRRTYWLDAGTLAETGPR